MLNHPLFRSPVVNTGLAKHEVGFNATEVVAALRRVRHYATTHGVECPNDGLCYNLRRELARHGVEKEEALRLESWLVYAFTGRELPIAGWGDRGFDSMNLWQGEQLAARLELIDALIQDIEA